MFEHYERNISWHQKKVKYSAWCHDTTRGCPLDCGVLVAGSSQDADCQKVELLDILTDSMKKLPNLSYGSHCVGMAWDRTNNSVVLAGGNQRRDGEWKVTAEMFLLINVGEVNSEWVHLQCKLPHAMEDPLLVMSDSHLYLLGCDPTGKGAKRIPRDSLEHGSEARDWENLEDLEHAIDSNIAKRGAVFILDKVVVFTFNHIMTLDLQSTPPTWDDSVNFDSKGIQCCIPRHLNWNSILVLMNRTDEDGVTKAFLEKYYPGTHEWEEFSKHYSHNSMVVEASLVPWQFFVVHKNDPFSL